MSMYYYISTVQTNQGLDYCIPFSLASSFIISDFHEQNNSYNMLHLQSCYFNEIIV